MNTISTPQIGLSVTFLANPISKHPHFLLDDVLAKEGPDRQTASFDKRTMTGKLFVPRETLKEYSFDLVNLFTDEDYLMELLEQLLGGMKDGDISLSNDFYNKIISDSLFASLNVYKKKAS